MLASIGQFVKDLYQSMGKSVLVNGVLQFVLGLTQGIGLLLLLPLLALVGVFPSQSTNQTALPRIEHYVSQWDFATVLSLFAFMIFAHALARHRQSILAAEIEHDYTKLVRTRLYRGLCQAKWLFLCEQKSAHLSHVLTTEIHRVANLVKVSFELLCAAMIAVVYIVVGLILHPALLLLALGCGLVLFLLLRPLTRQAKNQGVTAQQHMSDMYVSVSELLAGMKTIKSQAMEAQMQRGFDHSCDGLAQSNKRFVRANSATAFYHEIGTVLFVVLIVYIAIEIMAVSGAILLMMFLTFARLMPRLSLMLRLYQQLLNQLPAFEAVQTLQRQCDRQIEDAYNNQGHAQLNFEQHLVLENIVFAQASTTTLSQINMNIPAQSTIALVGPSGAGKTTLADVIAGLSVPQQGEVTIDGISLNADNRLAWRRAISYVGQEPFLFHDTIGNNLRWLNPDASEEALWQALEMAAAKTFVEQLPQKLDTLVGDRGIKLSGGEKQRIALARALMNSPQLLILDEATSALDVENEQFIQQAIEQLHGKMTIVIIAHRLSTVRKADQIYVLDKGVIVESGRWEALAQSQGQFAAMLDKSA